MSEEKTSLRILVLTRSTHFHHSGIFEKHIKTLYEGLEKRGHHITVLTTAHPNGIKTIKDKNLHWVFIPDTVPGAYSKKWGDKSSAYFRTELKENEFDIIHCQSLSGFHFLNQTPTLPCPVITTRHHTFYHDFLTHCLRLKTLPFYRAWREQVKQYIYWRSLYKKWEKSCFEKSNFHIAISKNQHQSYLSNYRLHNKNIFLVPNQLDPNSEETPIPFSHPEHLKALPIISLHLRAHDKHLFRAVLRCIKTLAMTRSNLHIVFTGTEKILNRFKSQISSRPFYDRCSFIAKQDLSSLIAIHRQSTFFLALSRYHLGYDRLQLSLMKTGTIILLNQTRFAPSLITHQHNGLILPLKNNKKSIALLRKLMDNPNQQALFIKRGKENVEDLFSEERMIEDIERVFHQVSLKKAC